MRRVAAALHAALSGNGSAGRLRTEQGRERCVQVVCVTLQDSLVSLIYKTRAVPTGHSPENRAELLSILEDGKAGPACSQLFPTAAPRLGSEKKPAGALTSTEHQPHFCTGCFHMHDLTESSGHPPPSAGARKAHFMGEAAGRVCGTGLGSCSLGG
ncbi:hypothetical protein CB1_000309025 [Camelus ferus]|nr:hypothetical protein CB1_000309025 [Camelus ferus]